MKDSRIKWRKRKYFLSNKKEDVKMREMLDEMDKEILIQKELEIKAQAERKIRVEQEMSK